MYLHTYRKVHICNSFSFPFYSHLLSTLNCELFLCNRNKYISSFVNISDCCCSIQTPTSYQASSPWCSNTNVGLYVLDASEMYDLRRRTSGVRWWVNLLVREEPAGLCFMKFAGKKKRQQTKPLCILKYTQVIKHTIGNHILTFC